MEIRNLRTFLQVAEQNSFTSAANILGYSQSTVSFQIRQLEDELECLLFERINHTVTLTERGRELLDYAQNVLLLTEKFKQSILTSDEPAGFVHIATSDSICESMMMANYTDFYGHFPKIKLKFSTADTNEMFRMLDHNEADIVFTLDSHVYGRDYMIAKEEPVQMHFVTGVNSRFADKKGITVKDIVNEPFVLTEKGVGYRRLLEQALEKMSLEIRPILELGRTDVITEVLSNGIGISFLPEFVTREAVRSGKLVYLDVVDVRFDVWKQLIYHRNKWISPTLRCFIDYVKQAEFEK